MEDPKAKIIITTIQKLDRFIKKHKDHAIFNGQIVLIFDECHRSQFGDMHKSITKAFNKYYLFWFTGTPIFAINSSSMDKQILELRNRLLRKVSYIHHWNAIADKNVLRFKVDYVSTIKEAENIKNNKIKNIDREKALSDPKRISNIVKYIIEQFNRKTKRNSRLYELNKIKNISEVVETKDQTKIKEIKEKVKLSLFNYIFAVSSIEMSKLY